MSRTEENDASPKATVVLLALFGVLVAVGIATVILPEVGGESRESGAPDAGITP